MIPFLPSRMAHALEKPKKKIRLADAFVEVHRAVKELDYFVGLPLIYDLNRVKS